MLAHTYAVASALDRRDDRRFDTAERRDARAAWMCCVWTRWYSSASFLTFSTWAIFLRFMSRLRWSMIGVINRWIFGAFVTSIDMNSGAPTFGTPEAAQITYGAGQLARRMGLPYRSAGSFNGSKLPDAQAAYETASTLHNGLLAGVNFMLHACGWLEGGLVASYEKFVMDADQLGALHKMAAGVSVDESAQAMDALREVGPGGHYLGCAHTQAHFKTAFWRSELLDYKPYETWSEEGARDTMQLATARVRKLLDGYEQPTMEPATLEALTEFVAQKKASMPDSFM